MHHPIDRTSHTTVYVTPVVDLEIETYIHIHIDRHTYIQIGRNRQTDRQTGRQADRQIYKDEKEEHEEELHKYNNKNVIWCHCVWFSEIKMSLMNQL